MKNEIVHYIRAKRRYEHFLDGVRTERYHREGVIIGVLYGTTYFNGKNKVLRIGYSLCSKMDDFDINMGRKIAMGRSGATCEKGYDEVPNSIYDDVVYFINRCERYFKPEVNNYDVNRMRSDRNSLTA